MTDQEADLADQDERQPGLQCRQPAVRGRDRRLPGIDPPVQRLGPAHLLGGGLDPHRLVADHLAVLQHRRDVGVDPVVVAVMAAVLDDAHPRPALLQGLPHVGEHRRRHVRVTHDVVRGAQQFVATEAADRDEGVVAVGDLPLEVGGGDQPLLSRKGTFALGDGLIVAHWSRFFGRGITRKSVGGRESLISRSEEGAE
ncbi:hypothetical protein D9M70_330710 [compost metagenome]